jgi:hypothetical protein
MFGFLELAEGAVCADTEILASKRREKIPARNCFNSIIGTFYVFNSLDRIANKFGTSKSFNHLYGEG